MSDQFGFDFGNTGPAFTESPVGTWLHREFTATQYAALIEKAENEVQSIAGPARPLFERALAACKAELQATTKRGYGDEPFFLRAEGFKATAAEQAAFKQHCYDMARADLVPRFEYKTAESGRMIEAAMYVDHIGTLTYREWASDAMSVSFALERDSFFLESFKDSMQRVELPYSIWGKTYCADKLAYASAGIASVPTFTYNGREYLNDGSSGFGGIHEGECWSMVPLADWTGPTYNYQSQCKAWDDGRLERGDRRGLIVSVRDQKCVLDGAIVCYDKNPRFDIHLQGDEAEEPGDIDAAELDDEEEAEYEAEL